MKCPFCGMESDEGALFCMHCGKDMRTAEAQASSETSVTEEASLENANQTDATAPEEDAPTTGDTYGSYGASVSGEYNSQTTSGSYTSQAASGEYTAASATTAAGASQSAEQKPKKKKGGMVAVIIVIVVLLLLCCCCGGGIFGFFAIQGGIGKQITASSEETEPSWVWGPVEEETTEPQTEDISVSPEESTPEAVSDLQADEGYLDGLKWRASDDSVIIFADGYYEWYRTEEVKDDDYYKGIYTVYTGDNAMKCLAVYESVWGITQDEMNEFFDNNAGDAFYNKDCFIVMILSTTDNMIDGVPTVSDSTPYYGFLSISDEYVDIANIYTMDYMDFEFITDEEPAGTETDPDVDPDADWTDLSFYLEGELMEWPLYLSDLEKYGFGVPEDVEGEILDSYYYTYSRASENDEGQVLYLAFKNYTEEDGRPVEECPILKVDFDDYYDLPDFKLANGLTIGSTLEEVEALMGEASYAYDSEDSTYKCREYEVNPDQMYSNGIEFTFYDGVVTEIVITNEDDE